VNFPHFLVPGKFGKFDSGQAGVAATTARSSSWVSAKVRLARAIQISAVGSLTMIAACWLPSPAASSSAQGSPEAFPAEACLVASRTRQEVAALLSDPNTATPAATTAGQTLPPGEPVAAEAAVILAIEGQRRLPDGRFGATVTVSYPSVPMPKRFFFYFTQVNDRLLIDGILGEISFSIP
jgi:hypothetical protein